MGRPRKSPETPAGQHIEVGQENPRNGSVMPLGRMYDLTHIPEFIEGRRVIDSDKKYRWARLDKVDYHRTLGYRPIIYDDVFKDTGYFEKEARGYVRLGDCILMAIPMRAYEVHQAEIRERLDRWEGKEKDAFHNHGASLGVETIEDSPEDKQ